MTEQHFLDTGQGCDDAKAFLKNINLYYGRPMPLESQSGYEIVAHANIAWEELTQPSQEFKDLREKYKQDWLIDHDTEESK